MNRVMKAFLIVTPITLIVLGIAWYLWGAQGALYVCIAWIVLSGLLRFVLGRR